MTAGWNEGASETRKSLIYMHGLIPVWCNFAL